MQLFGNAVTAVLLMKVKMPLKYVQYVHIQKAFSLKNQKIINFAIIKKKLVFKQASFVYMNNISLFYKSYGIVNSKIFRFSSKLIALISPLWAFTICFDKYSPNPTPILLYLAA